jgi:hypothetical protein
MYHHSSRLSRAFWRVYLGSLFLSLLRALIERDLTDAVIATKSSGKKDQSSNHHVRVRPSRTS